ncbi:hypothetical protein HFO72_13070 [Rhizobium laguerreae]|uniref:hypothetical protein n=1 Tax=Rhizobium laguerreae TaxID=1076926 RepID=UPI001C8FEE9A|nr:hypothetical protein [Rhizobium laguerreae]MBY3091728.1 hypothetical protein [Rhizobium laguerreae]
MISSLTSEAGDRLRYFCIRLETTDVTVCREHEFVIAFFFWCANVLEARWRRGTFDSVLLAVAAGIVAADQCHQAAAMRR